MSKEFIKLHKSGFNDWQASQLPSLKNKLYIITGGNSGIGFETANHLGKAGANIVLACRSIEKGMKAVKKLKENILGNIDCVHLDLSDLESVKKSANEIKEKYPKIDGLVNNAGIMMTPELQTKNGFELQVGTNHLGHFLFTGLLLENIEAANGRIAVVSSLVHKGINNLDLEDFMSKKKYTPMGAYEKSKGANLMFALELDKRLKKANKQAMCIACHPGYSDTNLQSTGPTGFMRLFLTKFLNPLLAQSPRNGALPSVLAVAGLEAKRGGYYGPQKMGEYKGRVSDALVKSYAIDKTKAKKLWELSEKLVDFKYNI